MSCRSISRGERKSELELGFLTREPLWIEHKIIRYMKKNARKKMAELFPLNSDCSGLPCTDDNRVDMQTSATTPMCYLTLS